MSVPWQDLEEVGPPGDCVAPGLAKCRGAEGTLGLGQWMSPQQSTWNNSHDERALAPHYQNLDPGRSSEGRMMSKSWCFTL